LHSWHATPRLARDSLPGSRGAHAPVTTSSRSSRRVGIVLRHRVGSASSSFGNRRINDNSATIPHAGVLGSGLPQGVIEGVGVVGLGRAQHLDEDVVGILHRSPSPLVKKYYLTSG